MTVSPRESLCGVVAVTFAVTDPLVDGERAARKTRSRQGHAKYQFQMFEPRR